MIGDRLAIGHDPAQHAAYTKHWVKILEDEPKEILRACADAEKICRFLGVEPYEQVLAQKNEQALVAELPPPAVPTQDAQEVREPQQVRRSRGRGR
jgi:antirestriction protein ArdC